MLLLKDAGSQYLLSSHSQSALLDRTLMRLNGSPTVTFNLDRALFVCYFLPGTSSLAIETWSYVVSGLIEYHWNSPLHDNYRGRKSEVPVMWTASQPLSGTADLPNIKPLPCFSILGYLCLVMGNAVVYQCDFWLSPAHEEANKQTHTLPQFSSPNTLHLHWCGNKDYNY